MTDQAQQQQHNKNKTITKNNIQAKKKPKQRPRTCWVQPKRSEGDPLARCSEAKAIKKDA
jgi:hypothetical protein